MSLLHGCRARACALVFSWLLGESACSRSVRLGSKSKLGLQWQGAPDEKALIKTAIRCVKDTVDLDLSKVKKWHRFLEITYNRPGETYKGTFYPEQTETTVIFVPELDDTMPDATAYTARVDELKADLDGQALAAWEATMQKRADKKREVEEKREKAAAAAAEAAKLKAAAEAAAKEAAIAAAAAAGKDRPASPPGEPEDEIKPEPEKPEESPEKEDPDPPKPEPVVIEGLPEAPALIPRPRWDESGDSKAQFKCLILSLDGLLDYNLDDDLEKNFEVSLFAELFQEMLLSKYAQVIRQSLQVPAPLPRGHCLSLVPSGARSLSLAPFCVSASLSLCACVWLVYVPFASRSSQLLLVAARGRGRVRYDRDDAA